MRRDDEMDEMMDIAKASPSSKNYNSLNKLFQSVEEDFMEYVDDSNDLCYLRSLFQQDNYDNPHVQQLYLLRYLYAYALENREMYQWLLKDYGSAKNLSVESIGCGCLVDAWALKNAADRLHFSTEGLVHKGVDIVSWHYKFASLKSSFIKKDAGDYFSKKKTLSSDIYIFPRSIGDFSEDAFSKIRRAFECKTITKPVIYLMISQRREAKYKNGKEFLVVKQPDGKRTASLFEVFLSRDYECSKVMCEDDYGSDKRLRDYDDMFDYPWDVYSKLKKLQWKCSSNGTEKCLRECPNGCSINRAPMLYMKHLSYNVFKFERK